MMIEGICSREWGEECKRKNFCFRDDLRWGFLKWCLQQLEKVAKRYVWLFSLKRDF